MASLLAAGEGTSTATVTGVRDEASPPQANTMAEVTARANAVLNKAFNKGA